MLPRAQRFRALRLDSLGLSAYRQPFTVRAARSANGDAHAAPGAPRATQNVVALLRGRDPVYRTLRELALSYFHEYHNERGERTLREYSRAFDLRALGRRQLESTCPDVEMHATRCAVSGARAQ